MATNGGSTPTAGQPRFERRRRSMQPRPSDVSRHFRLRLPIDLLLQRVCHFITTSVTSPAEVSGHSLFCHGLWTDCDGPIQWKTSVKAILG
jgi:hypothetical protein